MPLTLYPVPVVSAVEANERLTRYLARPREDFEFAADEIKEPITLATVITIDAVSPVIMALIRTVSETDRVVGSGWSYRRVDLKSSKRVDLLFTAPGNPREGFVFRVEPSTYHPIEIASVSAYLFTDRKFWYPSSFNKVIDGLKKNTSRPSAFEHRPQYPEHSSGRPIMAHSSGKPFDPESVLAVMPPLLEALSSFNPAMYAECVSKHASADYRTLFGENQDILIATRSVMAKDGNVAGPALASLVGYIWRSGMAYDLETRIADIDGLAKLLREQGNTSKRKEFDFDDDKCGAYVREADDVTTVFFRHEREAIAISRAEDRLVISAADYKSGDTFETYVDLDLEDGHVARANEAQPLRSHVTSLLRRWVHEIEGLGEEMEAEPEASSTPRM